MQRRSCTRLASHVKTRFLVAVHLMPGTRAVVGRRALNHGLGQSHASMAARRLACEREHQHRPSQPVQRAW
jgi:hypothetical protein